MTTTTPETVMTDLRALCVELLDALESNHQMWRIPVSPLVARARAALAAEPDGPAVLDGREPASVVEEPSDEEIEAWADQQGFIKGSGDHPCGFWINDGDAGALVRAALARYGNHFPDATKMVSPADALVARARAVLARPVAEGPTRDEVWELWLRLNNELPDRQAAVAEFWEHAQIDACVRYGPHPAPSTAGEVMELAAWLHGQDGSIWKRAIYSRAADLLLQQEGRIEQAYQYGRHDAEADAQQASESTEDEPGGLEQRHPTPVPVAEGPTDTQLIEEAIAVGLAFQPQDEVSEVFLPFDAEEPLDELLVNFARAVLDRWGHQPAPPAEGEVAELVALIRQIALAWEPDACLLGNMTAGQLCRAADLLEQRHPTPVPVSERLPELRGMFERILCVARSSGQRPVGNIQLADRLISAVVSWSALPLPAGEVQP